MCACGEGDFIELFLWRLGLQRRIHTLCLPSPRPQVPAHTVAALTFRGHVRGRAPVEARKQQLLEIMKARRAGSAWPGLVCLLAWRPRAAVRAAWQGAGALTPRAPLPRLRARAAGGGARPGGRRDALPVPPALHLRVAARERGAVPGGGRRRRRRRRRRRGQRHEGDVSEGGEARVACVLSVGKRPPAGKAGALRLRLGACLPCNRVCVLGLNRGRAAAALQRRMLRVLRAHPTAAPAGPLTSPAAERSAHSVGVRSCVHQPLASRQQRGPGHRSSTRALLRGQTALKHFDPPLQQYGRGL